MINRITNDNESESVEPVTLTYSDFLVGDEVSGTISSRLVITIGKTGISIPPGTPFRKKEGVNPISNLELWIGSPEILLSLAIGDFPEEGISARLNTSVSTVSEMEEGDTDTRTRFRDTLEN
tara:strand:+ start:24 stop:389 length:366 start_codon:yes stop_codon:yes gene_type:complete